MTKESSSQLHKQEILVIKHGKSKTIESSAIGKDVDTRGGDESSAMIGQRERILMSKEDLQIQFFSQIMEEDSKHWF